MFKTNDINCINYLLNELKYIELSDICFSSNEFKNYKNVIIHYTGNNNKLFFEKISSVLCFLIIDNYEDTFLNRLILQNYFYFDADERKKILNICYDIITDDFTAIFDKKFKILYNCFLDFISNNKTVILTGFANFRIKSYIEVLDEVVAEAVNSFIVEKEYMEFISLLKLYVNASASQCDYVHLVYRHSDSILLDEHKNIIKTANNNFKAKILSDITFSSNDYALNSLLTLLPKKIYVHLIDGTIDEFINTLQLIFEKKVSICTDCDICNIYKKSVSFRK